MLTSRVILLLLAVPSVLWALGTARGADSDAPLPANARAVWELEKAWREATPTRERVCLNGLWRWQPSSDAKAAEVPAGNWGFFKVPGAWPGKSGYARRESQIVHPHPNWKSPDTQGTLRAWYQREFTVPKEWTGRRVALGLKYLNSLATVYVDGKKAGKLHFPEGELDLTALVQPGGKYVLSIFVEALPLKEMSLAFTDTGFGHEVKGSVGHKGLCGDVFLAGTPPESRIVNVKLDPSVRKSSLTIHADLTNLAADAGYSLQAKVLEQGKAVKVLTSPAFKDADVKEGRYSFAQPWKPEKLWDLHTPQNQYDLELSLLDAAGKTLDTFAPVRFGFREHWIEGRDFMLNGSRVFWAVVPLDNPTLGIGRATYEAAKESLLRLQAIGINMVYTHNYDCNPGSFVSFDEVLKAADDVGMLVSLSQPHFHHYDWKAADAEQKNGYAEHAAFFVRVAQNHPSVVAYGTSHNATGYTEVMNPDMIDGKYEPKEDYYKNAIKAPLQAEAIITRLDPTRIVYHHSSGNLSQMYTSNFYLNFAPIQERSDWFETWATKSVKPAFLCEYGMPYFLNWTMYRGFYKDKRAWGSASVPFEFCLAEWDSQWLGDSAYNLEEPEKTDLRWEAKKFAAGQVWHHWDYPAYIGRPLFNGQLEVVARYTEDNWRAYRTWGLSGTSPWTYSQYWNPRDGANKDRKELKTDWEALQRPGYSPDYSGGVPENSMEQDLERADWVPTVAAKAIIRNNQPLLAYIGGKAGAFTEKGHNFRAGEMIEKQIVIVNNSRVTAACDCAWTLALPAPQPGNAKLSVATGEINQHALKFSVPAGTKPGAYKLDLTVKFTPGGTQEDNFMVHVLPDAPEVKAPAKVAIFDPPGETTKLLAALGVRGEAVQAGADLSKYDLLIVGKGALTPEGPGPDLARVREGLKTLVFEQHSDVLEQRFGFRVQEYGLREVFPRVPSHPALAGLTAEHLKNWRGEATNTPPRLKYFIRPYPYYGPSIIASGIQVPRVWRCGNRANVASVLIEKPACGDFLTLVDGGFNLQYGTLLEYREGQGLVLFCQMDVTARTEDDPAAERLARNLLGYLAAWKPEPVRTIVYAGDPAGLKHIQQAGYTVEPYASGTLKADRVLVVGPGGGASVAPEKAGLAAWLKQGGRVLALGLDAADAGAFLPGNVAFKKAEHIGSYFEPPAANSPLAGAGPADVHNRDPREIPLVAGGAQAVGDGVLAVAEEGRVVLCQLPPWQFNPAQQNTKRTFRRTSSLLTRLLGNLGVQGKTPLLERFVKPVTLKDGQSAEQRWLTGFYLDKPEEWDDPYRFFGW